MCDKTWRVHFLPHHQRADISVKRNSYEYFYAIYFSQPCDISCLKTNDKQILCIYQIMM